MSEASLTGARGRGWGAGRRVASVSDEPKNAASERVRRICGYLSKCESPPSDVRASVTDDFVLEDRRRGPTFPTTDADSFPKYIASTWDTGAGQPRFTVHRVLAVRGDRLAVCWLEADYGNGWTWESIEVMELDTTLTLIQRMVDFDVDDVDAAIAELDRLQSQADAG